MEFDWDEGKRQSNFLKHQIDFEAIAIAFFDPNKLVSDDIRRDYGETRTNILAKYGDRVCNITYTTRGSTVWIISARKANKREQKRYARL